MIFKVFRTLCFPYRQPKLDTKYASYVFLIYAPSQRGYQYLENVIRKVHVYRHVIFVKHIFPYQASDSSYVSLSPIFLDDTNLSIFMILPSNLLSSSLHQDSIAYDSIISLVS